MLLQAVWPDHDWDERRDARKTYGVPTCSGSGPGCTDCGSTGLLTEERKKLLNIEALAKLAYEGA